MTFFRISRTLAILSLTVAYLSYNSNYVLGKKLGLQIVRLKRFECTPWKHLLMDIALLMMTCDTHEWWVTLNTWSRSWQANSAVGADNYSPGASQQRAYGGRHTRSHEGWNIPDAFVLRFDALKSASNIFKVCVQQVANEIANGLHIYRIVSFQCANWTLAST